MISDEQMDKYPSFHKFQGRQILGIDYGSKVIGLATFCPGRDPAPSPYDRIVVKSQNDSLRKLEEVIEREVIEDIVFGIPLYADQTLSPMAKEVQKFALELKNSMIASIKVSPDIYFQDETLTSYKAEERMKASASYNFKVDQKKIDSLSAAIILEDFIKSTKELQKI